MLDKVTKTNVINLKKIGLTLSIAGWIHRKRNHGGVLFLDVRDFKGIVQCVINPSSPLFERASKLRDESCVFITGELRERPEGTINPEILSGEVELVVEELTVFNACDVLPFEVNGDSDRTDEGFTAPEHLRLKYRYLDLRRPKMQKNLKMRAEVLHMIRNHMYDTGFTEVQTPILTASSPEGARDYLVPARLHPGKFYALPQAPQIFKQLLMASGIEKYYQIAPCFRDEAGRSDRSPGEFYQLDLEIAFGTQEDVFEVVQTLLTEIFMEYGLDTWQINGAHWNHEWRTIPYKEAMLKYGTDKPDLRAMLELIDLTELFRTDGPPFIVDAVKKGQVVRGLHVWNADNLTGKFYKDMEKYAQDLGMPGLGYVKTGVAVVKGSTSGGPLAKFMTKEQIEELEDITGSRLMSNTLQATFILLGSEKEVNAWGADLRVELSKRSENFVKNSYDFCWITDYPMFEMGDNGKIEFSHNPFSMPQGGMQLGLDVFKQDPLDILAYQYDVVCNGIELSSGAVRNHRPDLMLKAFEIAGYDKSVVESKFPSLWNAFHYGCPPHAGIAPGIDRIVMLLTGEESIREVIAFPMNQQAEDLMMGAPNEPTDEQLKELNLCIVE